MDNRRFLPIRKIADVLGLSVQTIRRWEKDGKLKAIRSPGNRWLFSVDEVKRLVGMPTGSRVVIYARVSSAEQKTDGNLQRQVDRLHTHAIEHGYDVVRVFSEQASGINENRKQLSALLKLAEERQMERQMERVLIEFPDRLARFGYRYLERFLNSREVAVEVTHKTEPKSSQEELVQDLLTIVTVFSTRLYGKRAQEFRQRTKKLMDEMDGDENHGEAHQDDQTGNS